MNSPNIIFLLADDHRFDILGAAGNLMVHTPHLDALAQSGALARNMHIMGGFTGGVCRPCRAAIHTGANPFRAGGARDINPQLSLLGETLRQHNYHTHAIGKWHNDTASFQRSFCSGARLFFGGMSDQYQKPLHDFNPSGEYPPQNICLEEGHSTELFTESAVRFLETYDNAKPFFLHVAFTSPHDPRTAPQEFHRHYSPDNIPLPPNFLPAHPFDNGELTERDEMLAAHPRDPAEIRRHIADYYAMVSHMDHQIGNIMKALERSGQRDNTIIVYTSDHGLALGQHGLMGKQNLYDHSIRVPFIISGPQIARGRVVEQLASQIDVFPTLCEIANTAIPASVEGNSMLPWLRDNTVSSVPIRKSTFSVYRDMQRAVKKDAWKLIQYYRPYKSTFKIHQTQLFNTADDPWEMRNRASDSDATMVLQEMQYTLSNWQQQVGDHLVDAEYSPGK